MPETQGSHGASRILDQIVESKRAEVESLLPMEGVFRREAETASPAKDLVRAFSKDGEVALMAEVKRRSPGAGPIRPDLVPGDLARGYEGAGAAAISCLTDLHYFGGSLKDLREVGAAVEVPVFRKDFVIHPIQLLEARGAGADGVLLIARILTDKELRTLHDSALDLGLSVMIEVHAEEELGRALDVGGRLVGINNRNLQNFTTSLDVTLGLLPLVPNDVVVVSESGIRTRSQVERLGAAGVHGILVGETLLRAEDPALMAAELSGCPRVPR